MSPHFFGSKSPYRRRRKRTSWIDLQRQGPAMLRQMLLCLLAGTMALHLFIICLSFIQSQFNLTSHTLKKWTNHISLGTFAAAITVELPQLETYNKAARLELPKVSNIMMEMATSLNPEDPRTLIRREIPDFAFFDGELLVAGQGVTYADISYESSPPLEVVLAEREAVAEAVGDGSMEEEEAKDEPKLTTEGRPVVFIYHTHNRESWLPHLPSASHPDEAFHPEINITKVGLKLGEELEKRGVGTLVDTTDFGQLLNKLNRPYTQSYAQSREVVEAAMQENEEITFLFDIHRDAVSRESSTYEMDGKTYARPFFIIGKQNPDYEKNAQFAERINRLLEERYPGLSRGVLARSTGNAEYNQSISDQNVLIEIGGVENTLEESYRTAEILAEVIAELYWEAEKVNAPGE